jgi:hypothetical protein
MVGARAEPTEYESEKTEPFSQTEYAARLESIRAQESFVINEESAVHLDDLVVPSDKDIRILVRPLRSRSVSPGNRDNCEWLALHAEVAAPDQPEHRVLAVTQTSRDIKFWFRVPGEKLGDGSPEPSLWCELYYDPASDNQILLNKCDIPITLSRISQQPLASPGIEYDIFPGTIKALSPGTWRIKVDEVGVLDFRILEKRPAAYRVPSSSSSGSLLSDMVNSSGKRSFIADDDDVLGPEARRVRSAETTGRNEDGVIMFLRPTTDPLVFPLPNANKGRELIPSNAHALLNMQKDDTVEIPGGCEMDCYQITKRDPIASTSLSTVFTGTTDHPKVPAESVITVKVLKTRSTNTPSGEVVKAYENERNVIRQADIWMREFTSHETLNHKGVVRLYGGDARHLSLYMEHVDARDLSAKGHWRAANTDFFSGTRQDALRILRDIAGALNYIHGRNLVHNDIKPANILYSRERGAVLCDFGLSTHSTNPASTGGTPYYVPPEFIGRKLRGGPSDAWALGITMLYVLRKIAIPESRARQNRPKPLYWMIADLNKAPAHPHRASHGPPSAISQMQMWLAEVNEAKEKLNLQDKLERMVAEMLVPNPQLRATMKRVIHELKLEETG